MQIKNLQAQQQLMPGELQQQQQGLQQGQQEIQKNQFEIQDREAGMKAMQQWDGKDMSQIPDLIQKNGGSLNAVVGSRAAIVKQQADVLAMNKAQLEMNASKNDYLLGKLQAATGSSVPDEQLGQSIMQAVKESVQDGYLDPQAAQHLSQLTSLPPDQMRQQLSILEKGMMGQQKQFSQAQEEQKTKIAAQEADIKTKEFQAKMPGGPLADTGRAQMQDWLSKNPGKGPADYEVAMKKIVPAYNFNLQNQGATGAQGQPSAIAKGIADGSIKWSEAVSARTPMAVKQAMLAEVKSIKPDFNSGDATIERAVLTSATSGDISKNLTAFNTAIEHAKQLSTAADALDNGNVVQLNKIGNALGYQFGSNKTTNFNVVKNALSGEISKVFKGGGATDAEIEAVQGPFSAANSPAQLKGAIQQAISLMNSKRDALKQQVEKGRQAKPNFGEDQTQPNTASPPKDFGPANGKPEGATGTLNGNKVIVKNGRIVAQ